MPGQGKHQRQSMFGYGHGVCAGRIHHGDAGLGGGFKINVVHAYAGAANHAQLRRMLQHVSVHQDRGADDQSVGIAKLAGQAVFDLFRRDHRPARFVLQKLEGVGGNFFSDDDLHTDLSTGCHNRLFRLGVNLLRGAQPSAEFDGKS